MSFLPSFVGLLSKWFGWRVGQSILLTFFAGLFIALLVGEAGSNTIIYAGTYTGNGNSDSKGVYAFSFNEATSALTPLGLSVTTPNPSYILVHPSRQYLYAVQEQDPGRISAFKIDSNQPGRLTLINQQLSAGGSPCYLSTNRAGDHLFVANYGSGTVAVLPINTNDGSLKAYTGFDQHTGSSVNADRQRGPYAHSILLDRIEQNALSADLGSDQIYTYRFVPQNGSLIRVSVTQVAKLGDGPRHLVFNANDKFVFVLNELLSSVTVYNYFPSLRPVQTVSTLPAGFSSPNTGAELLLHPITEKFLYVSNRGHNSIAVFAVDLVSGSLSLLQHISVQGLTPRNFQILPSGKHLIVANQDSNNLVVFSIDSVTGRLTSTGSTASVSRPTCLKVLTY